MFVLKWTLEAEEVYQELEQRAETSYSNRKKRKQKKSSKIEGLFKQVYKTVNLLKSNPRHPGLHTHEYDSIEHPFDPKQKVFEAYVQITLQPLILFFGVMGLQKNKLLS